MKTTQIINNSFGILSIGTSIETNHRPTNYSVCHWEIACYNVILIVMPNKKENWAEMCQNPSDTI